MTATDWYVEGVWAPSNNERDCLWLRWYVCASTRTEAIRQALVENGATCCNVTDKVLLENFVIIKVRPTRPEYTMEQNRQPRLPGF